jgi:hypothetical protein
VGLLVLALLGLLIDAIVRCDDVRQCRFQSAAMMTIGSGATLLAFALSIWTLSTEAVIRIASAGANTAGIRSLVPLGITLLAVGSGWLFSMSDVAVKTPAAFTLFTVAVAFAAISASAALSGRPRRLTIPALRPDRTT